MKQLGPKSRRRERRKRCLGVVGALFLCHLLFQPTASAQFTQYTPAGTFNESRESTDLVLQRNIDEARWKAGRVLLDPWFGVRDIGYVSNVQGTGVSDYTATAGIGIRGWLPLSSEFTLAAHFLPEYVWWKNLTSRNRWNGRYGVGLFGNLGRTGVELSATRVDDATFFSREFEDRVNNRVDEVLAKVEVDLGRSFRLFTSGTVRSINYLPDDEDDVIGLSVVDRDEGIFRLGVGFTLPRGFEVGVGIEASDVSFDPGPSDFSNSGLSPLILARYEGSSLSFDADMAFRSLDPEGSGSRFVEYDGTTGHLQLGWRTMGRLQLQLFGGRDLVYSFSDLWAYFEDSSIGVGLRGGLSSWANARVFVETGDNDYTPIEPSGPNRADDYSAWGGDIDLKFDRVRVYLQVSRTSYDSNFPGGDRDLTIWSSSIGLGFGSGLSW